MEQSYKILTAQRLAIDPNELLNYFELHERAIATTPDGEQHIFTFAELRQPAKETEQGGATGIKKVANRKSKISDQKSAIK